MVARAIGKRRGFSGLRRFDIARDLGGVADLLEEAFAGELEAADMGWLREMKALRFLAPLLWFISRATPGFHELLSGFVWVEDGRIVGNVNVNRAGLVRRDWLISNVAVHPAHRRRGIARQLMQAAIDLARRQGGEVVTLRVRRTNTAAQNLYRSLGFTLLQGTTSLRLERVGVVTFTPAQGFPLRPWGPDAGWKAYELARAVVPARMQWLSPLRRGSFELTFERRLVEGLSSLMRLSDVHRWAVEERERFVATLIVHAVGLRSPLTRGHTLEMMVHPDRHGLLEEALVTKALSLLKSYPPRSVETQIPADHEAAIEVLKRYGFVEVKTLDRLGLELTTRGKQRPGHRRRAGPLDRHHRGRPDSVPPGQVGR